MKTTICAIFLLTASLGYSQVTDKICKEVNTITLEVEKTSEYPNIENFKGDFQFRMTPIEGSKKFALTDQFFVLVEEKRSESDQIIIDLGNSNELVIAPKNSLDVNGHGPFDQPFIQK